MKGIAEQDISEWDFIMDVNLKGVMLCLKSQLKVISEGGAIVNAASIAGLQGRPNNAAYAASKHGVIGLTRSAAKEVGTRGVRVNCVCPYVRFLLCVVSCLSSCSACISSLPLCTSLDHFSICER